MLGEQNDDHHDLNEVVIKTRIMINMVVRTKVMIRNREMMTVTNMVIKTRIMIRIEMVI